MQIASGGQTGVDRAALDVALKLRLACGGWCPKGRRAEDGILPRRYPLRETPSEAYAQRTEWNVRDSDATLVVTQGIPTQGTALTIEFATRYKKPCYLIDIEKEWKAQAVIEWMHSNAIEVLNIAGPRESKCPGIYRQVKEILEPLFKALRT